MSGKIYYLKPVGNNCPLCVGYIAWLCVTEASYTTLYKVLCYNYITAIRCGHCNKSVTLSSSLTFSTSDVLNLPTVPVCCVVS
jgi:hypothetical protein